MSYRYPYGKIVPSDFIDLSDYLVFDVIYTVFDAQDTKTCTFIDMKVYLVRCEFVS